MKNGTSTELGYEVVAPGKLIVMAAKKIPLRLKTEKGSREKMASYERSFPEKNINKFVNLTKTQVISPERMDIIRKVKV